MGRSKISLARLRGSYVGLIPGFCRYLPFPFAAASCLCAAIGKHTRRVGNYIGPLRNISSLQSNKKVEINAFVPARMGGNEGVSIEDETNRISKYSMYLRLLFL
jgi:hypothetical protein